MMMAELALANSRIISHAQGDHVRPTLQPDHVEGPDHEDGRDHRRRDADDQRDGEALHGASADQIQDERREHGADVRVDNCAHRVSEPLRYGRAYQLAVLQLFADALEDQHVGVHRDADRQHQPGEPRQRQREPEAREPGKGEQHVQAEGRHGEHAGEPVVRDHDQDHEDDPHDARADAVVDRVLAERGADGALLDDGEGRGQRTGAQHQRQVLRVLEGLRAQLDLPVLADLTLDDGRLVHHAAIEDDGHVVPHVAAGLALEGAPAVPRQREVHHRLVRERVAQRGRLLELFPRDDRSVLDRIERAVAARGAGRHLRAPPQLDAARQEPLHLGPREQALRHGHLLFGHQELPGELALIEQRGERPGGVHARLAQRLVDLGERVPEPVLHVRDAELEKGGALDDALGARRVLFARELDDEPVVADHLHHGLGHAELVDAGAHHALGAPDRFRRIGNRAFRSIHLEREVDPALEIEAEGDRDTADGRVLHHAGRGVAHALGGVGRDQRPDAQEHQPGDDDQSSANRRHTSLYPLRTARAAAASRSIWSTNAWRDGNVCTSRNRRTHSTVTVSPYSSPAKSNRWISRPRACTPNVGRGPWFIMPPWRAPRHSTHTAYTPSGGSSLRGSGDARLIVGTPIVRPRPAPRSTAARRLYGRPSPRSADARSPCATAVRMSDDEIACPTSVTAGTTSITNPSSRASRRTISTSPARPCPNPWSYPRTNSCIPKRVRSTSRTNSSGASRASSGVNATTSTRSMPSAAASTRFSSDSVSSRGAALGFTTSSGCGSNVTSRLVRRPACSVRRTTSRSTAWCPRWIPSNVPTVATAATPLPVIAPPRRRGA